MYLRHVLATRAFVLYFGSAVLDGKKTAAMILQVKDKAVKGRSRRNVYFLGSAVVVTMYEAGALASCTTYSLGQGR